ncbi:MAG: hypothetical protein ACI854_002031, partial [Arenicella sp.]
LGWSNIFWVKICGLRSLMVLMRSFGCAQDDGVFSSG